MGKEFAKDLLKDGHIVYGAARRLDKMNDIQKLGVKVIEMDVTDEESMVRGIQTIQNAEGRIDILINNAGFGSFGAIEEVSTVDARYQLEVNVFGAARLMQLVIPGMRNQHYGRIINISSMGGKLVMPMAGWYHASKYAIEAISDSLRNEVGQFGINVVVIEPGAVKSEWGDIAMDHLQNVSGKGAYSRLVTSLLKMNKDMANKLSEPGVISKLVRSAIASKKPKARYAGGHMAKPFMFMRWLLPDNIFDKAIQSQLK